MVLKVKSYRFSLTIVNVTSIFKYGISQIMVVEDDVACVLGTKIVTDYEGVTMSHFVQATPSLLKKMVAVSQVSMKFSKTKYKDSMNCLALIRTDWTLGLPSWRKD